MTIDRGPAAGTARPAGQAHNAAPPAGRGHNAAPWAGQAHNATRPAGRGHNAASWAGQAHKSGPPGGRAHNAGPWAIRSALLAGLVALLVMAAGPAAVARAGDPAAGPPVPALLTTVDSATVDPIAHDPTLIKQGRYYYEIITGDIDTRTYLPIRRSSDLVHWTFLGTVFDTPPAWVVEQLGITPGDFWAPDITFFAGEYHLYYAASSFGTNNSVIGLATTPTLDPASPRYRWTDRGMVLRTSSGVDDVNAIDPDVVFDAAGVPWMSYGSFWDGIRMRRLDATTGLLSPQDPTAYRIASRGGAAIEGAAIMRRDGYYYLFVSFDYCCRGVNSDYRVMVGRATSVTGPYLDAAGMPLLSGGGTELLRGYNGFAGPGGGDVYRDGARDLYVHHYYDAADGGLPKGSVRVISWAHGWPTLGDPLSGNRGFGHGPAYLGLVSRGGGGVISNVDCGYEGADLRLAAASPTDACQQWRVEQRGAGYASATNRYSNKVAEVAACVDAEGARVAQWGWLDNDCQKFRLVPTGDGWSTVESRLSGRVLGVAACTAPGAAVQTFTRTGDACQQWRLDPVGEVLIAAGAGDRLLDAPACRAAGRTTVLASGRRTGDCQLWRFVPAGGAYFTITDPVGGRVLAASGPGGRVVLEPPGRGGPAARWRIEPLDGGGYRLVNAAGRVLLLDGARVRHAEPTGSPAERLRLLTP